MLHADNYRKSVIIKIMKLFQILAVIIHNIFAYVLYIAKMYFAEKKF